MIHSQLTSLLQRSLRQARAESQALPLTPDIELFLLNSDFPQHALTREEMLAVMEQPAYWAFCWASGQVLAQFLLEQPQWVEGKRVLDFGSGSGVVAVAAAKAGAERVVACDIDPEAIMATKANARLNNVVVDVVDDFSVFGEDIDLIIVADVLYDRENLPWLSTFLERAPEVLVADSRVKIFYFPPYCLIDRREGTTVPDLDEFDEFRQVRIYHGSWK